jgi:hypothetical protein
MGYRTVMADLVGYGGRGGKGGATASGKKRKATAKASARPGKRMRAPIKKRGGRGSVKASGRVGTGTQAKAKKAKVVRLGDARTNVRGSFARSNWAESVKTMRALARGTLSAAAKRNLGPTARIPKSERLTGAGGAKRLLAWRKSGYRKF